MFDLQRDEVLCDDFLCALKKRILLQGRMYVFEQHVCFHSNIFGYEKIKSIPLRDVTALRRAKNLIFPNSIEVVAYGKREFFTSFISREDAYRVLATQWLQCSPYAKLQMTPQELRQYSSLSARAHSHAYGNSTCVDEDEGATMLRENANGGGVSGSPSRRSSSPPQVVELSIERTGLSLGPRAPRRSADSPVTARREVGGSEPSPRHSVDHVQPLPRGLAHTDIAVKSTSSDGGADLNNSSGDGGKDNDTDTDEMGEQADHWWLQDSMPDAFPDRADTFVTIATATLPCKVTSFLPYFFNNATFEERFRAASEHVELRVSEWAPLPFGYARDISFRSPVNSPIGPKSTACHQTQRFCYDKSRRRIVIETSQVQRDIPYGEYFTVETRWDVESVVESIDGDSDQCLLTVSLDIPFSRRTIWQSKIEKSTTDEMADSAALWIGLAKQALKPPAPKLKPISVPMDADYMHGEGISHSNLLPKLPPKYADQIRRMLNLPKTLSRSSSMNLLTRSPSTNSLDGSAGPESAESGGLLQWLAAFFPTPLSDVGASEGAAPATVGRLSPWMVLWAVLLLVAAPYLLLGAASIAAGTSGVLPWESAHAYTLPLAHRSYLSSGLSVLGFNAAISDGEGALVEYFAAQMRELETEVSRAQRALLLLEAQMEALRQGAEAIGIALPDEASVKLPPQH